MLYIKNKLWGVLRDIMKFDVKRKYIFDNFFEKNFRIRMILGNYA
jgi:hypothetical protein